VPKPVYPLMWFNSPVDNHFIAIENTRVPHTIPFNIAIERSFGMTNIVTVEIQGVMCVVICGRRKTSLDTYVYKL